MSQDTHGEWTTIIKPKESLLSINLKELWDYRDLCSLFIRRDITTQFKQTVLGPLWFIIQPTMTVLLYTVVFGNIAQISTDGLPQPLFYLAGVSLWGYFSGCLGKARGTFAGNAALFGKVYFPRLIVPISGMVSGLLNFGIQMLLFGVVYCVYVFGGLPGGDMVSTNMTALLFPLYVVMLAGLGLGFGIIFSSFSTKYRDVALLLNYVTSLWMYATPIIYPMSTVSSQKLKLIMQLNPVSSIFEGFKYGFLGAGEFSWTGLTYSFTVMVVLLFLGVIIFNRVQRNFMDTV
ncbi:MAG: ABC transporter permease [Bacteroidales bacterium]|nr:ABC transporter permease [Bacteroidales bacterium]